MSDTKKRPVHEVTIGHVRAAIWKNKDTKGPWHSVTFERLYKDGAERKSSGSFGFQELLVLSKVEDQAHTWIIEGEAHAESQ